MRGYVVQFSARIKAENVSRKPQPWNGVKFMAPIVTDQEKTWPAAEMGVGTFDWQRVAFRAVVPEDAKQSQPGRGPGGGHRQGVVRRHPRRRLEAAGRRASRARRPAPVYKGHDLPRLRGAMVSPDIDEAGLRVLGQAVERQPRPLATRPPREDRGTRSILRPTTAGCNRP